MYNVKNCDLDLSVERFKSSIKLTAVAQTS